jgi:hypothetical protein
VSVCVCVCVVCVCACVCACECLYVCVDGAAAISKACVLLSKACLIYSSMRANVQMEPLLSVKHACCCTCALILLYIYSALYISMLPQKSEHVLIDFMNLRCHSSNVAYFGACNENMRTLMMTSSLA